MSLHRSLSTWLPVLQWGRRYDRQALAGDAVAAAIVTLMLVPQSLAYAALAGLPPQAGLYASIAPLVLYAVFGTSHALAVGPVAVVSLMTATAIGQHAGTADAATLAITLAFLSGLTLLAMGALRGDREGDDLDVCRVVAEEADPLLRRGWVRPGQEDRVRPSTNATAP